MIDFPIPFRILMFLMGNISFGGTCFASEPGLPAALDPDADDWLCLILTARAASATRARDHTVCVSGSTADNAVVAVEGEDGMETEIENESDEEESVMLKPSLRDAIQALNTRFTMMTKFCHDFPKMLIPVFLLVAASCPFVIVFIESSLTAPESLVFIRMKDQK